MKVALVATSALALCSVRWFIPSRELSLVEAYTDFAHVWVGLMLATLYYEWYGKPKLWTKAGWASLTCLLSATAFETALWVKWRYFS